LKGEDILHKILPNFSRKPSKALSLISSLFTEQGVDKLPSRLLVAVVIEIAEAIESNSITDIQDCKLAKGTHPRSNRRHPDQDKRLFSGGTRRPRG